MSDFFNPYAFVPPWPRRSEVPALRDRPPKRLGRLHEGRWSGRLRLRIAAVTPLLITEQGRDEDGLAERGTRSIAGTPLLASSSVKGSVRSEFEAVTGSRYGVFEGHQRRLGYRASTRDSSDLVPVRITTVEGSKRALLLDGMRRPADDRRRVLKAAWVPRYGHQPITPLPKGIVHGTLCNAWVVLMCRERRRARDNQEPGTTSGLQAQQDALYILGVEKHRFVRPEVRSRLDMSGATSRLRRQVASDIESSPPVTSKITSFPGPRPISSTWM